jgi:UDP-2,3-diacylglucosamine hydrolase
LGTGDYGYRILKRVLRNPVNIFLYSLLHPDLGIPIARAVSHLSRAKGYARTGLRLRAFAERKLAEGYDAVILGHSHLPGIFEEGHGVYLNVGDWRRHFTYGLLCEGRLTLEHWT